MITEDYVNPETAKLLKGKGYKGPFDGYYNDAGCVVDRPNVLLKEPKYQYYERVSLYMAMKWLRETHNIFIAINIVSHTTVTMEQKYYFFKLYRNRKLYNFPLNDSVKLYFSYEEACESAIITYIPW